MGPSRYFSEMNRAFLLAVIAACLILPAFAAAGSGAPVAGGSVPVGRDVGAPGAGSPPVLFPNVSFPTRAWGAEDWYERGFALTSEERYAEAVPAYEQAVALDSTLLNAWYYLGDAFFRLGRYREALLAFGNATAIDPDFVDAYFYEGLVYRQLGLPQEEKAVLGRGLEAADRKQAKEGTKAPAGSSGGVPVPVSSGASLIGVGAACALRAFMHREKR